ncbi:hypothetical protein [Elizabethkingia occulta]|uniref:hypothetical protein n=1 Tax=Elizabethkingia occulta TaxID=1867263 RepID=UPI00099907B4|nr:hypothetical protein [Elizabethkingia occulta]OPB88550.1 hypothetical protein BB020_12750 [Elizabethkingia occulta]
MNKKALKISLLIIIPMILIIIGFYVYSTIIGVAMQKAPELGPDKELETYGRQIEKETKGSVTISPVLKPDLETKQAKQHINIFILNDSLTSSDEKLKVYVDQVAGKVKHIMRKNTGVDSIIIEVGYQNKNARYSYSNH